MITTLALLEPHAAVPMRMETSALGGDAALWSLQPAAMTITAAALMITPSATLMLELANW